ncbi:chemotaxis protein CheW [Steroidobacter denitrificans]|uniref:Chemotaxis protein CheW n=1 Tax=Steroidobacter denitrificans TaxID=465721 RepID=A0A127F899_STEDE|nr:chemotaxis protein CheW [Steroidobacter denitrificans]AMN46627.1 chemotaxis protein CheW [Steroidobacter denitrificans]
MSQHTGPQSTVSNQMLTFTLGEETYGVDILRVQEIRGWSPVTRIPQAPAHVLGVLNLRGSIVPIVDLRMRFNLEHAEYTPLTVIIVLSVESAVGRRDFGLVVDGVSDVVDVAGDDIKPAPEFGEQVSTEFIEGIAAISGRMVMLLDIDRLIGGEVAEAVALSAA